MLFCAIFQVLQRTGKARKRKIFQWPEMGESKEFSSSARLLHDRIIAIMKSQRVAPRPEQVIQECTEAAVKLCDDNKHDKINDLVEIILRYREHLQYSDIIFILIQKLLAAKPQLASSLVRALMRQCTFNSGPLLQVLMEHAEVTEVKQLLRKFFNTKQSTRRPSGNLDNFVSLDTFFEDLEEEKNASDINRKIHIFLRKSSELTQPQLLQIVKGMKEDDRDNLEILKLVLTLNRKNVSQRRLEKIRGAEVEPLIPIACPKLVDLVSHEVFSGMHSEYKIESLFTLLSDMLLPAFIPVIEAINVAFLQDEKFSGLLRNIASYIKAENFIEIIKPIQIAKHCQIFRSLSNSDISTYLSLYQSFSGDESQLNDVIYSMPGFTNFCTDHTHSIDKLLRIFRAHIHTHRMSVCAALEKLLDSHMLNIQGNCILDSPVDKTDSVRVLESVTNCGIFSDIVEVFCVSTNTECNRVLELMVGLTGADLSGQLADVIMNPHDDGGMDLYSALRLLPYFVNKWQYDYSLVAELLSLCLSNQPNISKKAYHLLGLVYSLHNKVCICDLLFSVDSSHINSSSRDRLSLLVSILRRGCPGCKCPDMSSRFFSELFRSLSSGNVKARKFAGETVIELVQSPLIRAYLLGNLNDRNNDPELLGGCLSTLLVILEHITSNQEYLMRKQADDDESSPDRQFICSAALSVFGISLSSEMHVKRVLQVFILLFPLRICKPFHDEMLFILTKYIPNFNKKYNRELKECVYVAKAQNIRFTKEMALLLKFKNTKGKSKDIPVLKNRTS